MLVDNLAVLIINKASLFGLLVVCYVWQGNQHGIRAKTLRETRETKDRDFTSTRNVFFLGFSTAGNLKKNGIEEVAVQYDCRIVAAIRSHRTAARLQSLDRWVFCKRSSWMFGLWVACVLVGRHVKLACTCRKGWIRWVEGPRAEKSESWRPW